MQRFCLQVTSVFLELSRASMICHAEKYIYIRHACNNADDGSYNKGMTTIHPKMVCKQRKQAFWSSGASLISFKPSTSNTQMI